MSSRSVNTALSTSLFAVSVKPAKDIDELLHKVNKRLVNSRKIFTRNIHEIFSNLHSEFTPSIKQKVKRIAAVATTRVEKASNEYYTKAEKLSRDYQNQKISYEVYERENTLSLTNTYLAEALAYEEASEKISKLTGLVLPEPSVSKRKRR